MQTCQGGSCLAAPCAIDADCAAGRICGVLSKPGKNAPEGFTRGCMVPGPSPLGGSCGVGSDCATGQCYDGRCVERCGRNSDCGTGECMVGPITPGDAPFCSATPHCGICGANQFCDAFRDCQPG
jgi:hypothetical protein